MKITLSTQVDSSLKIVKEGFNETLFLKLSPPFPLVKLLRFDGCLTGHHVWLELNFLLFKQRWDALIIEHQESEKEFYFIDEGSKMPFFLKSWRHKHLLKSRNGKCIVTDQIQFSTGTILTDVLVYPLLWFQFVYRKPIYRKHFRLQNG